MDRTNYLEAFQKENPGYILVADNFNFQNHGAALFYQEVDSFKIAVIYEQIEVIGAVKTPIFKTDFFNTLGSFLTAYEIRKKI